MASKNATKSAVRARESTSGTDGDDTSTPLEPDVDKRPAKKVRSEGQRLLMLVPGSLQQIGDSIGATKQAVALWRDGARVPEEKWRRKLHALYDILPDAWGYGPGEAPVDEPDEPPAEPQLEREPTALEDVSRLLSLLRTQLNRPNLLARERAQLGDAFARALTQKERLERAREMLEDRVIREHPQWQRLKNEIIAALIPHPEAARDVEAAIARVLAADAAADDVP
jgi:hypothetical protein